MQNLGANRVYYGQLENSQYSYFMLDEREFRFLIGSGNINDLISSGSDFYNILPNRRILFSHNL